MALIRPLLVSATDPISICRFSPFNSTADWVEVCNSSSSPVNLSNYYIVDKAGHREPFNCEVQANSKAYVSHANWLNNTIGDKISLMNSNSSVPVYEMSYGVGTSDPIDMKNNICAYVDGTEWKASNDSIVACQQPNNNNCPIIISTPAPSATPSVAPSNTPTPVPTATGIPGPSLSVANIPSSIKIGQSVTINFTLTNAISGHNYAIKPFGGASNYGFQTQNGSSWLNYNSSWSSFFAFQASSSTLTGSLTFQADSSQTVGAVNIAFKAYDLTLSQDASTTSAQSITINSADPTVTPSATSTPTPTPSSKITPSPTPTDKPIPSDIPIIEPTSPDNVRGVSTQVANLITAPQASPSSPKSIIPILPFIFIGIGALLLVIPLILAKIKK